MCEYRSIVFKYGHPTLNITLEIRSERKNPDNMFEIIIKEQGGEVSLTIPDEEGLELARFIDFEIAETEKEAEDE